MSPIGTFETSNDVRVEFAIAPRLGHKSDIALCPRRATSRHIQRSNLVEVMETSRASLCTVELIFQVFRDGEFVGSRSDVTLTPIVLFAACADQAAAAAAAATAINK